MVWILSLWIYAPVIRRPWPSTVFGCRPSITFILFSVRSDCALCLLPYPLFASSAQYSSCFLIPFAAQIISDVEAFAGSILHRGLSIADCLVLCAYLHCCCFNPSIPLTDIFSSLCLLISFAAQIMTGVQASDGLVLRTRLSIPIYLVLCGCLHYWWLILSVRPINKSTHYIAPTMEQTWCLCYLPLFGGLLDSTWSVALCLWRSY